MTPTESPTVIKRYIPAGIMPVSAPLVLVIEFVIDTDYAAASDLFNRTGNGLINSGNYNNYDLFRGEITKVEKVKDELNPNYVEFVTNESININSRNIFNYASGY